MRISRNMLEIVRPEAVVKPLNQEEAPVVIIHEDIEAARLKGLKLVGQILEDDVIIHCVTENIGLEDIDLNPLPDVDLCLDRRNGSLMEEFFLKRINRSASVRIWLET